MAIFNFCFYFNHMVLWYTVGTIFLYVIYPYLVRLFVSNEFDIITTNSFEN